MTNEQLLEEINQSLELLADSTAFSSDRHLWDAVRGLALTMKEIVAKLPKE